MVVENGRRRLVLSAVIALVRLLRVPIHPMIVVASFMQEPLRTVFALDEGGLVIRMGFLQMRYQLALAEKLLLANWTGVEP